MSKQITTDTKGADQPKNNAVAGEKAHERVEEKKVDKKKGGGYQIRLEEYADDSLLYNPRITPEQRVQYWEELVKYKPKPKPPRGFDSWIKKDKVDLVVLERKMYHPRRIQLLHFIVTAKWDYCYLILFFIFATVTSTLRDGFGEVIGISDMLPVQYFVREMLGVILLGMFVSQFIPVVGMVYLMHYNNDMVKCYSRQDLENWGFCAVLIAQVIEFAHYGGRGNEDGGGHVKRNLTAAELEEEEERAEAQKCSKILWAWICCKASANSKVHPDDDASSVASGDLEMGSSILSGSMTEEGNDMKLADADAIVKKWTKAENGSLDGIEEEDSFGDGEFVGTDSLETGDDGTGIDSGSGTGTGTGVGTDDQNGTLVTSVTGDSAAGEQSDEKTGGSSTALEIESGAKEEGKEELVGVEYLTEEEEAKLRKKREAMQARAEANALVKEWHEWDCIVCGKKCKENKHPPITYTTNFGIQGAYYKRVYAFTSYERDMPRCPHCMTYADYAPPAASAHLFPHNPEPYNAFEEFPPTPVIQNGLSTYPLIKLLNSMASCCFGYRNSHDSKLIYPDWRTHTYITSRFPEIPRPEKPTDKYYEVGETLECKLQRSDWHRCKVTSVYPDHTYDVLYENGVPLRFVNEKDLRMLPDKRLFAYINEVCIVMMILLFPLSMIGVALDGYEILRGLVLIVPCSIMLLCFTSRFLSNLYKHHAAGFVVLFGIYLLFSLPVWFMLFSGITLLNSYRGNFIIPASLFVVGLVTSLPTLYFMKPAFCLMCVVLFFQLSSGVCFLALLLDDTYDPSLHVPDDDLKPMPFHQYPLVRYYTLATLPIITSIVTCIIYRVWLNRIWDVSVFIRPTKQFMDIQKNGEDTQSLSYKIIHFFTEMSQRETIFAVAWDKMSDMLGAFG